MQLKDLLELFTRSADCLPIPGLCMSSIYIIKLYVTKGDVKHNQLNPSGAKKNKYTLYPQIYPYESQDPTHI